MSSMMMKCPQIGFSRTRQDHPGVFGNFVSNLIPAAGSTAGVKAVIAAILLLFGLFAPAAAAQPVDAPAGGRFFISGDGRIRLDSDKNKNMFSGRYRTGRDQYDPAALRAICMVFDAPYGRRGAGVSLRLIEFLDYLQDHLAPGALITITSGYRDPDYNTSLRHNGKLAAKASLHQYGMAADLKMKGIAARRVWDYVKAMGYGGAGYYHGQSVHVDVGPARSWDETTSGVGTGISDDNKLIGMVSDYDIYRPGEAVTLRFIRMTAFPIEASGAFALERLDRPAGAVEATLFKPVFPEAARRAKGCLSFGSIEQMAGIQWRLPADQPPGRYRIRAEFCGNPYPDMPGQVSTPEIKIEARSR